MARIRLAKGHGHGSAVGRGCDGRTGGVHRAPWRRCGTLAREGATLTKTTDTVGKPVRIDRRVPSGRKRNPSLMTGGQSCDVASRKCTLRAARGFKHSGVL